MCDLPDELCMLRSQSTDHIHGASTRGTEALTSVTNRPMARVQAGQEGAQALESQPAHTADAVKGHPTTYYAKRSQFSAFAYFSFGSLFASSSFLSVLCLTGIISIASVNAILSVCSLNSILSIASLNSILSIGCSGAILEICV